MKYKVGDKVRIVKERAKIMNSLGKADHWLGKVMTIRKISYGGYYMEEDKLEGYDGEGRYWSDDCIEGLADEELNEGDIVYVSVESEERAIGCKDERIFICKLPDMCEKRYVCVPSGDENLYENGDKIDVIGRKYAVKKPTEHKKTVTLELTDEQLEKIESVLDL